MNSDLSRFIKAHHENYNRALQEIKNGQKQSHWMWYIFPQIKGLGVSEISKYYAINSLEEARLYLENEVLNAHLIEISKALLELKTSDPTLVFGDIDALKLNSSMTLFNYVSNNELFAKVIDKFFNGIKDQNTIRIIEEMQKKGLSGN